MLALRSELRTIVANSIVPPIQHFFALAREGLIITYNLAPGSLTVVASSNRESRHCIWTCSDRQILQGTHVIFRGVGESVLMIGEGNGTRFFGHLSQLTASWEGGIGRVVSQISSTIAGEGSSLDLHCFTSSTEGCSSIDVVDDLRTALEDTVSVRSHTKILPVDTIRQGMNLAFDVGRSRFRRLGSFDEGQYTDVSNVGTWNRLAISTDE